jgi:phosphoribosylglycinamide formyltransferase-1
MVHLVPDEGVDDGPVLASQRVPITADDTRETLEARLHEVEHELFVATIADYLRTR